MQLKNNKIVNNHQFALIKFSLKRSIHNFIMITYIHFLAFISYAISVLSFFFINSCMAIALRDKFCHLKRGISIFLIIFLMCLAEWRPYHYGYLKVS